LSVRWDERSSLNLKIIINGWYKIVDESSTDRRPYININYFKIVRNPLLFYLLILFKGNSICSFSDFLRRALSQNMYFSIFLFLLIFAYADLNRKSILIFNYSGTSNNNSIDYNILIKIKETFGRKIIILL
jgi:hypothetical protein